MAKSTLTVAEDDVVLDVIVDHIIVGADVKPYVTIVCAGEWAQFAAAADVQPESDVADMTPNFVFTGTGAANNPPHDTVPHFIPEHQDVVRAPVQLAFFNLWDLGGILPFWCAFGKRLHWPGTSPQNQWPLVLLDDLSFSANVRARRDSAL